jgi:hypothetical protein
MPGGMTGHELALLAKQRHPSIKVLLSPLAMTPSKKLLGVRQRLSKKISSEAIQARKAQHGERS